MAGWMLHVNDRRIRFPFHISMFPFRNDEFIGSFPNFGHVQIDSHNHQSSYDHMIIIMSSSALLFIMLHRGDSLAAL